MNIAADGPVLPCARHLFDIPDEVAYFNNASLSPTLRSALAAGHAALERRARPWTIGADDWFASAERRRALFADLVGAASDDIALVPASSYGIATAAANLPARRGQRVLVLADEYPSGVYTWRRFVERTGAELVTVRRGPGQQWADAVLEAIDEATAVVSVPQVHWTDGSLVDLARIAPAARRVGAALVVDASQSAGAMPLDVAELRPDFLVAVGYKWLLGPFGLGYLYVRPDHQDGRPLEENWIVREGAEDFAALVDYPESYQPGARRFDVGQRTAFELTPMAIAALEQLSAWTVPAIAVTLRAKTTRITAAARELGLQINEPHGPHMLGIGAPDALRSRLKRTLDDAGVHVGQRGAVLRVSPHLHVSDDDVSRLIGALESGVRSA